MVNDGLFLLLALMVLLLVMFLYAVITLSPEDAIRTEPPVLNLPAPPLPHRSSGGHRPPRSPQLRPASPGTPLARPGRVMPWCPRPMACTGPRFPAARHGNQRQGRDGNQRQGRSGCSGRQLNTAGPYRQRTPVTSSPAQRRPERATAGTTPTGTPATPRSTPAVPRAPSTRWTALPGVGRSACHARGTRTPPVYCDGPTIGGSRCCLPSGCPIVATTWVAWVHRFTIQGEWWSGGIPVVMLGMVG
jgi:hypothetical protein